MVTELMVALLAAGGPVLTPVQRFEPAAPQVPVVPSSERVGLARAGDETVLTWVDGRRSGLRADEGRTDLWLARYRADAGLLPGSQRLLCVGSPVERLEDPHLAVAGDGGVVVFRRRSVVGAGVSLRAAHVGAAPQPGAGCDVDVVSLTDGGTIAQHQVVLSAGRAWVTWVEGSAVYALATPRPANGGPLLLGRVDAGVTPFGLSAASAGDGGILVGWTDRSGAEAVVAAVGDAWDGTAVARKANASSVTLAEGAPDPVAMVVKTGGEVFLAALGGPPGGWSWVSTSMVVPVDPAPLLASNSAATLAVHGAQGGGYASTAWAPGSSGSGLTTPFPPGFEPRAVTASATDEVHVAARRIPGGELVLLPGVTLARNQPETAVLRPMPQARPTLAWLGSEQWLLAWSEGPSAPASLGRRASLGLDGAVSPSGSLSGLVATTYRTVLSNAAGTRAAVVRNGPLQGQTALTVLDLSPLGPAVGDELLPPFDGGEGGALGDSIALQWGMVGGDLWYQHGPAPHLAVVDKDSNQSESRCAAPAGGRLWLPSWDDNRRLVLFGFVDAARAMAPIKSVHELSLTPNSPEAPCAAGLADEVLVTWSNGQQVALALFSTAGLEMSAGPLMVSSVPKASNALDLAPTAAPFPGGWLLAWQRIEANGSAILGAILDKNRVLSAPFPLSEDGASTAVENAGPCLQVSHAGYGPVGLAWNAFSPVTGAWGVRVRVVGNVVGPRPDAGPRDGGGADAGLGDGGVLADGGVGAVEPVIFTTSGCSTTPGLGLVGLVLIMRRRPHRGG